jgi:hypothetical protein
MNGLPPESLMDNEVTAIRGTLVYDRDLSVIFRGLPPDDVYTDLETTTINLTESVYRDFRLGGVDIQALQEFVRPGSPLISAMRLQTILDNRLVGRLSRRTHSYFPVEQIETLQPYQATLRFEMPHFPPLDHLAGISRFDRFQLMFAGFWQSVRRCCCCEPLDEDDVINHRAPD